MTCEELPDAFRPLVSVHHANGDTAEIAFARCDGDDEPRTLFPATCGAFASASGGSRR